MSCTTGPSNKNYSEEGSFLERLKTKAQLKAQKTQKVKETTIRNDRSDYIKETKD